MIKVDAFFKFLQVFNCSGICRVWFFPQNYCQEIAEIVSCSFKKLSFPRDKFVGMNIIGSSGLLRKEKRFAP